MDSITFDHISSVLAPRSVAIIGASDREGNRGGTAAALLRKFGYEGEVYPVHPSAETVGGYRAYSSLSELPAGVDLAIVGLGAASVSGLIPEIAAAGIRGVIVWAGGFSETGEDGARLQSELSDAVAGSGLRLLGPNCLGVVNTSIKFTGTFASWLRKEDHLVTSGISMVSQSGGLAANAHAWSQAAGVGFRFMVSTGNEVDLSVVDVIDYFAADPGTNVITCYLEGVRDGVRLTDAIRRARAAGKAVVILKVGHSAASASAIAAHTGALAGETRVWDALLEAEGAIQVRSIEELLEVATYLESRKGRPPVAGNRLMILGHGGGAGVLAADQASFAGLEVAALSEETKDALRPLVPAIASVSNPFDMTPEAYVQEQFRRDLPEVLRIVDESGEADILLLQFTVAELMFPKDIAEPVRDLYTNGKTAVAVYSRTVSPEGQRIYADGNVYVFDSQRNAIETLGRIAPHRPADPESFDRVIRDAAALGHGAQAPDPTRLPDVEDGAVLAEHDVHELLHQQGFETLRGRSTSSRQDAVAAAEEFGYPVVLKVLSTTVTHRASAGLVRLGVASREDVERRYDELVASTERLGADLLGVFVQKMATGGAELLVSAFRDPVFGPVISVGAGGVQTELIDDVGFARAPLDERSALELLDRLRSTHNPKGLDLAKAGAAAVSFLVRFSRLVDTLPWAGYTLELNPVLVSERSAIPLDGLLIVTDSTTQPRQDGPTT
jgi:acyl-CoA synthetase (NDP forming)